MSETDTPQEGAEPRKVYPGNLDDFTKQREARIKAESQDNPPTPAAEVAMLVIAEQLTGLNYILDGIRYAMRDKR